MSKRQRMLEMAALALGVSAALTTAESGQAAPKKGPKKVECFGVNTCKGTSGCAISKDHIEAANKAFNGKFAKSKPVDCAGNSECAAKGGHLAWVAKANNAECWNSGGFVFEKDSGGKLLIHDKSGIKKTS